MLSSIDQPLDSHQCLNKVELQVRRGGHFHLDKPREASLKPLVYVVMLQFKSPFVLNRKVLNS